MTESAAASGVSNPGKPRKPASRQSRGLPAAAAVSLTGKCDSCGVPHTAKASAAPGGPVAVGPETTSAKSSMVGTFRRNAVVPVEKARIPFAEHLKWS